MKKIGKDSVVLITLEQGNQINKKFVVLADSIKNLKLYNDSIRLQFQQEFRNATRYKADADSFYLLYSDKKKAYTDLERVWKADRRSYVGFSVVLMILTVLFAGL